jgi:transcriptional regulator with XRE-family HTH domain
MTPSEIKEARISLGLSQAKIAELTGGKPDSARWRQYELGKRPLPQMKALILSEMQAGVPEFTINTDVKDARHWIEHTRYPRLKWAVEYTPDETAELLVPVTAPPEGFDGNYDELAKRAWTAWNEFHTSLS